MPIETKMSLQLADGANFVGCKRKVPRLSAAWQSSPLNMLFHRDEGCAFTVHLRKKCFHLRD